MYDRAQYDSVRKLQIDSERGYAESRQLRIYSSKSLLSAVGIRSSIPYEKRSTRCRMIHRKESDGHRESRHERMDISCRCHRLIWKVLLSSAQRRRSKVHKTLDNSREKSAKRDVPRSLVSRNHDVRSFDTRRHVLFMMRRTDQLTLSKRIQQMTLSHRMK